MLWVSVCWLYLVPIPPAAIFCLKKGDWMTYVELDKRICPDTWQSEYFWYDVVQHRVLQVKQGSFVETLDRQLQIKIQHMYTMCTHTHTHSAD